MAKVIQITTSETEGDSTLIVLLDDGSLWWTSIMGDKTEEEWHYITAPPSAEVKAAK